MGAQDLTDRPVSDGVSQRLPSVSICRSDLPPERLKAVVERSAAPAFVARRDGRVPRSDRSVREQLHAPPAAPLIPVPRADTVCYEAIQAFGWRVDDETQSEVVRHLQKS